MNTLLTNFINLFLDSFDVDDTEITVSGFIQDRFYCDELDLHGLVLLSQKNEYGVPIYNVYVCTPDDIDQIPCIFGHDFESNLETFVKLCLTYDFPEDLVLLGCKSRVFTIADGKIKDMRY